MMILKDIFYKPVDRPIEGVIKADDEASLRLEIEEYVLTLEVEKRLENFIDAYNNYTVANGVWISGFFGSGKSHLLKMLALLLENRSIDGVSTLDLFLPKCGENEILRGDLKRAVAIPSKSILFNIDQKSDVISKTQVDALLSVFVKVFDEMCGYYGKQGHIAQFERDLDSRGLFVSFKTTYESMANLSWSRGREQAILEADNISKAYAQVTGSDETKTVGILDKYRSQYRVSIEDFAEQINTYIERQAPGFRLNFFIDEVGQFIAENIKLMTNLQTIAESLATKCRGRAWVIVTAQEDMGTVVGEMGKQQGNDFSKIQARFANRMKLTSADVAEVIQRRLLTKNDTGICLLSELYHEQVNNFKTLFDFADGSQTYQNFKERDHFIHTYPFIPYQFALLQSAIQNLSAHNAFEGKFSSVGERSMLGVFQQVAIQIGDHPIGQLATFDLMFEGIRTVLKSQIQKAIIQSENQLKDPFANRLLKALFLVKYVKEYKATVRNLSVLMRESFHQDQSALRKQVEEALNLLEQQTYIQRNGDQFAYLTDEEKDVEQEIKNTEVESSDVADELEKIVFDNVLKNRKIRYEVNGQDYSFSRKLDDRLYGREHELSIHVISPFHENAENESSLKMQSMGRDELLVLMPADERLVRDLLMYKRTEKYIRQNISITQQEAVKRILSDKGQLNRERQVELNQRVQELLGKAKLFVAGGNVEVGTSDAQARVVKGFQDLIVRVYPNLTMLRGFTYTENDIAKYIKEAQEGLFGNDATSLDESEQDLLAFIHSNHRNGVRTTLKNLLEKFERKPYGWNFPAVLCTLAKLCARGKVAVRTDGNLLEQKELEQALRNTACHGNVVLEPQIEFSASQVRDLKEFFEEFFDTPPQTGEAKALGKETGIALNTLVQELNILLAKKSEYPFLQHLILVLEKLKELTGKPYTWYLTDLLQQGESLFQMKEEVIDPIRKFMAGQQKTIYDEACSFFQAQEPNLGYVRSDAADKSLVDGARATLHDPLCFKGNHMQQIKLQVDALKGKVHILLKNEIEIAKETMATLQSRIEGMAEFTVLEPNQKEAILQNFQTFNTDLERQSLIAMIRDSLRRFEENDYPRLLSQLTAWAQPTAKVEPSREISESVHAVTEPVTSPPNQPRPHPEIISSRAVKISFSKAWLADANDVDRYLESMREALMVEIRKGKRIQI